MGSGNVVTFFPGFCLVLACLAHASLENGEPKEMNLKDFFRIFLDFRTSAVLKRAKAALAKTEERKHYISGLLVALANIDEVVRILRSSESTQEAAGKLREGFGLSQEQADGILGMPLRRLTSLESASLEKEHASLAAAAAELSELIGSKKKVLEVIEREALALKEEFGSPRRTRIEAEGDKGPTIDPAEMGVKNEAVLVVRMPTSGPCAMAGPGTGIRTAYCMHACT